MLRELDLLTVLSLAHHHPSKWVMIDYFPMKYDAGKFAHRVHAACAVASQVHRVVRPTYYRYDWWRIYYGGPCVECGKARYTP